jgi:hypothetical protein
MHGPYRTDADRTQQAPAPARRGRASRPIDRAVAAIEHGKVIRSLLATSRPGSALRTASGRGWQRHGHVPHTRKTT